MICTYVSIANKKVKQSGPMYYSWTRDFWDPGTCALLSVFNSDGFPEVRLCQLGNKMKQDSKVNISWDHISWASCVQRVQELIEPDLPKDADTHTHTHKHTHQHTRQHTFKLTQRGFGPGVQTRTPVTSCQGDPVTPCRSCRSICGMRQIRPWPPGCPKAPWRSWLGCGVKKAII